MALTIRPADLIKARVIDYLIEKLDGVVIGDEIMYGSSRKIVDLLALYNGETYAIEIKSNKDDLRRLPKQISEYSKIFDHTSIFSTCDHLDRIRDVVKSKASVFELRENGSINGKFLEKKNRVLKSEMLATMNSSFIRKKLSISNATDSDEIRRKAMRFNKETIHSLLYDYFMGKCLAPFNIFIKERGDSTDIDDLVVLSNRLNVEYN